MSSNLQIEQLKITSEFFDNLKELGASLPFDLLPKEPIKSDETVTVAGFELAKQGDLNIGEEFIWNIYWDAIDEKAWYSTVRLAAATLILRTRYRVDWAFKDTIGLGQSRVNALFDFFLEERNARKPKVEVEPEAEVEPEPEEPIKKKTPRSTGRKTSGDSEGASLTTSAPSGLAVAV